MTTKPILTFIVALSAAVLPVQSGAAALAAATPSVVQPSMAAPTGTETGNLYERPPDFAVGQKIEVIGNFPRDSSGELATLYRETSSGVWTPVATQETNSYGNSHFRDYQVDVTQKIYAQLPNGNRTEVDTLTPKQAATMTTHKATK